MKAPFKRPLGDEKDKFVFGLSFFGGLFSILFIRIVSDLFFPNEGISFLDFLAILVAISVIFLYTTYIRLTKNRSGISVDRASDNVYYLGLLFTLASLAYSLIKLSLFNVSSSPNTGYNVLSLLPDFGLALFSTIAGIFFRIYLQQLRNDPMDVETEAREELGIAIRQLRVTIGEVVGSLSSLSQQTSVTLSELNSAVSRTLEQTASENTLLIKNVANDVSGLSDSLKIQVSKVEEFTTKSTEAFTQILSTINQEFKGFGNIPVELGERFNALSTELRLVIENTKNSSLNQTELSIEMVKAIKNLQIAFSEDGINRLSIFIDQAEQKLLSINNGLEEDAHTIQDTAKLLGDRLQSINTNTETVANLSENIKETADGINEASSDYIEEVTKATIKLKDKTDEL